MKGRPSASYMEWAMLMHMDVWEYMVLCILCVMIALKIVDVGAMVPA
jgi:hypothetical protein